MTRAVVGRRPRNSGLPWLRNRNSIVENWVWNPPGLAEAIEVGKIGKETSVFDDPSMEIQEITAVIKQDITALNSAVVDLQLLSNSHNASGNISSDTTTHSTTVVDDLKNRLMSTTKEFKDVLTMRTENLKVHENRRQLFSSSASKNPMNSFVRQRPLVTKPAACTSATPPLPWANGSQISSQLFPKSQVDGDTWPLLPQQQNLQQQHMVPLQDSYMQSRAEALQNVESTIHELGNIFNQLATLVSQQGEIAMRIDENMDDTVDNVEGAQGALLKYLNSISSSRWLMIKIFLRIDFLPHDIPIFCRMILMSGSGITLHLLICFCIETCFVGR